MIAPIQDGHSADPRPLREVACAAFQPGGALAGLAAGDFEYEARPQQVEMARAVSDALESSRHLVVEAGTGVGKSLAYLVPLLLHAKRSNTRAMVSTHTISLQEQLVGKDLPLLKDRLGIVFRAALVKFVETSNQTAHVCNSARGKERERGREEVRERTRE